MKLFSLGITLVSILCSSELVLRCEAVRDVSHSKTSTHSVFFLGMILGSFVFILAVLGFILLTYRSRSMLERLDEDISEIDSRSGSKIKGKTNSLVTTSASSLTIGTQSVKEAIGCDPQVTPTISHSVIGFVNPVYHRNQSPPQSPVIRRRQQSIEESTGLQKEGSMVVNLVKSSATVSRTDSNSSASSVVDLFQRSLSCINTAVRNSFPNPSIKNESKNLSPATCNPANKKLRSKKRVSFKLEVETPPSV